MPFLFTAGKGMDERVCELRVRFKRLPTNAMMGVDSQNELVMRVQPDESLYMITCAKEPDITAEQVRKPVVMDMTYAAHFHPDLTLTLTLTRTLTLTLTLTLTRSPSCCAAPGRPSTS